MNRIDIGLSLRLLAICVFCFIVFPLRAQVIDTTTVDLIEKPGFVEHDLNNSISKKESLFDKIVKTDNYDELKEELFDKTTIKFSVSYQGNIMHASNVVQGKSDAAAGLFLLEAQWKAINAGKDYEGEIVFAYNNLHTYGSAAQPGLLVFNTGSMFPHDALYVEANGFISNLYWEQWFKKDRFFIRVGQHAPLSAIDFSRFADVRTSVTNPAIGFPAIAIPFGPPALGITAKWLPPTPTGFYLLAHISDINSEVDELNFDYIFETGDVFAGAEFGYNWGRMGALGPELDHVHLLIFGATEASKKPFTTRSGWGFKITGEKQFDRWVSMLNYTYNTSSGGSFGFTNLEHLVNLSGGYAKPFGIKGEFLVELSWGKELDYGDCGLLPCDGRDQTMMEAYWKILVLPQLWLTPGLQMHIDPVNNPNTDLLWVPLFKFRTFF